MNAALRWASVLVWLPSILACVMIFWSLFWARSSPSPAFGLIGGGLALIQWITSIAAAHAKNDWKRATSGLLVGTFLFAYFGLSL